MAPPRPYWKGYLKLSLVSCPISLYSATSSSERISFRQINKKTGNRLRQQLVDEDTGEKVEAAEKGKGYEVDKGVYLRIEDEEIEAIEIESNHTIEIDRFVPKAQVDERYVDSPYYLIPNDKAGLDAFSVIRDAMNDKSMVALGRVVLSKRERVLMLQPWGKGLMGTTLRYPYEVRAEKDYFDEIPDVKIPKEMLALAEHILETKKADFDPAQFHDRYEQAIAELIDVKKLGMPPKVRDKMVPRIVGGTDLMAALRQSIKEVDEEAWSDKSKTRAVKPEPVVNAKPPKGKAAKRNPNQRELLLPIAGGAKGKAMKEWAKEQLKKPAKPADATAKPSSRKAS
jgi:DNA end-binding protein Ku